MSAETFQAITFEGSTHNLRRLSKFIHVLINKQKKAGGKAIKVDFIGEKCPLMYGIQTSGEGNFQFDTDDEPAFDVVKRIAELYSLSYEHYYECYGMYGAAHYHNGLFIDIQLSDEDVARITTDSEENYLLDGKQVNTEGEAIDMILDEKKNAFSKFIAEPEPTVPCVVVGWDALEAWGWDTSKLTRHRMEKIAETMGNNFMDFFGSILNDACKQHRLKRIQLTEK